MFLLTPDQHHWLEVAMEDEGWCRVETRARQHGPCWRVMEIGHPSTRVVETGLTGIQSSLYNVLDIWVNTENIICHEAKISTQRWTSV